MSHLASIAAILSNAVVPKSTVVDGLGYHLELQIWQVTLHASHGILIYIYMKDATHYYFSGSIAYDEFVMNIHLWLNQYTIHYHDMI